MAELKIGEVRVGDGLPPFVIAEAGVNHEGDMNVAKRMIDLAADNGAQAIKFQTYKAERLAARESPAYWKTDKTQRDFFKMYDRFWRDEYLELAEHARKRGIIFLSTPFDEEAVDFLDEVVPAFKIASADMTNLPFLRYVARKGKPMLISTGAATIEEIRQALLAIESEGNDQVALLHCILSYPTPHELANLRMIQGLKEQFPHVVIGYSDHTVPDPSMVLLVTAYLLGASILEKHYTLDKTLPGNDHYHAMDPDDLRRLTANLKLIQESLGQKERKLLECELPARQYARRSLVAKVNIKKGQVITEEMLTAKRPGTGISPAQLHTVVGRQAARDIPEDTVLQRSDFV
ncbi:MAG TPA: acetylneuraminic acid synthetase [Bacteroidetes bacterium]|nr:acetylneuraminic acid synthetase [Bacteroidota bacterium]